MATLHDYGTAHDHAKEGYEITDIIYLAPDNAAKALPDDIRLILGSEVYGRDGVFEMAVMMKSQLRNKDSTPESVRHDYLWTLLRSNLRD